MSEPNFSVLILAAGKATRFKSEHSKMLHLLAGVPLGEYALRVTHSLAPQRTYLMIGHKADEVRQAFARPGLTFIEQKQQLGTGHALMVARDELAACPSAHLLVLVGDAPLLRVETLRGLLEQHITSRAAATVLTTRVENPFGYGRIVRGRGTQINRVRAIVEERVATPAHRKISEINSGILCFARLPLLKHLAELSDQNAQKEFLLTDMVRILDGHGSRVLAFSVADWREVLGVNDRVELAMMERILRQRKAKALAREGVTVVDPKATYIDESVEVGADTIIEPGAFLRGATRVGRACSIGPHSIIADSVLADRVTVRASCVITNCEIGSGVVLGPFAHLREGAFIEPEARIGNFMEVKKTRMGRGSKAMHLSYLGDATVGAHVNIGAGTVTCNYDGEKKNPTRIEDGVFIGSGSMLVAPVSVGKGSYVAAGSTITQNVPPESLALGRALQVTKEGWVRAHRQSQSGPTVTERQIGKAAVLDVAGRVTFGASASELGKRIRQAIDAGRHHLLLNLSSVAYIDSSGIGELVGALSRMRKAGGEIKIALGASDVLHLFHVANLDRVFEIFPDESAALASFASQPDLGGKA